MTIDELVQHAQQLPSDQRQLPLALWHAGQLVSVQGLNFKERYAHGGNPPCLLVSPYSPPAEAQAPAPPAPSGGKK